MSTDPKLPAAPPAKPGWMTASYWLSLIGVAVTVLVVMGIVPARDSETVTSLLTTLITQLFVLIGALVPFWQFVHSKIRTAEPLVRPSPDAKPPVKEPAAPDVEDFRV